MKKFTYTFLSDASLRIDSLTLRPWPDFHIDGDHPETRRIIAELLQSDDPLARIWRGKIPHDVLEAVMEFPQCLWQGLLEVSQLNPTTFVHWSESCPAILGLMAMNPAEKQTDRDIDRLEVYSLKRAKRLRPLGLPPTREVYRIISKLPVTDCFPVQLEQLREAVKKPDKRKLMRHLKSITIWTLETLQLSSEYLDVNLLSMEHSEQMPAECNNLAELCTEIINHRQVLHRFPAWPYRGSGVSLHQLIQARNSLELELALGSMAKSARLPAPPVTGINSSKIKVEPLTTVRALFQEGGKMGNCIMTYARHALSGTHYAYRMLHPQRATILLVRRPDDWYPVEIRTAENGYAAPSTVDLVHAWVGTLQTGEEVPREFPF